uniref:Predicted amidohydrolase n=1 Tax=Candidatus Kentrum sp. DK TaxID=2126562 RepID=A0A450S2Z3_9GAMM|nr:MAG: Predicted amidohydrolase [Candidatus Kentron sp. DK]
MSLFVKSSVRVAAIQSLILQGERDRNIRNAMALFDDAMRQKPRLVCFTQAFATGVNFIILNKMAEPVPDGAITQLLMEKAAANQVHIAAGILEKGDDGKVYDAAVLIGPDGALLGKYRRWMRWGGELNYISPGTPRDGIDTEIGKIGLLVGYDVCFPEAAQHYFRQRVDIIIYSASVFRDLRYNVRHLCGARAMDNHCHVVFAGAIGEHQFANMHYMGGTCICGDPYFEVQKLKKAEENAMEVLASAGSGEDFIVADIHVSELAKVRDKLPFLDDLNTAMTVLENASYGAA